MAEKPKIFEEHYNFYLDKISGLKLPAKAEILGARVDGKDILVTFFGKLYRISNSGITGPSGKKPPYSVCIVLFNYVLNCPHKIPEETDWMSYKDFKDAAPLVNFFTNEVEKAVAVHFAGKLPELEKAAGKLEGKPPDLELSHDFAKQFTALPRVELLLAFNDKDEQFPAQSSVLFQRRIESFLDMESAAIVGSILADYLI